MGGKSSPLTTCSEVLILVKFDETQLVKMKCMTRRSNKEHEHFLNGLFLSPFHCYHLNKYFINSPHCSQVAIAARNATLQLHQKYLRSYFLTLFFKLSDLAQRKMKAFSMSSRHPCD